MKDIATLAISAPHHMLARDDGANAPRIRLRGYQWTTVFLPEGTQLRAWDRSGFSYAEVIGDIIVHQGEPVSPHQFICRCQGISRSAWAEVALLFPGENHWKRADAHRVLPIPTQAHHLPDIHALAAADRALLDSPERRQCYRRQADLLLD